MESADQIHQMIEDLQAQLSRLRNMVDDTYPHDEMERVREEAAEFGTSEVSTSRGTVVEGVFDGQNMVGPDGKVYTVPANYASKSKLVEGDLMKLTIKRDGSFLYKQIGPVERLRQMATLVRDEELGVWRALTQKNRSYRLLTASVTYYKGEPGNSVIILVPEDGDSRWAAVENIVPAGSETDEMLLDGGDDGDDDLLLDDGDDALLEDGGDMLLDDGDDALLESGEEEDTYVDTDNGSAGLNPWL